MGRGKRRGVGELAVLWPQKSPWGPSLVGPELGSLFQPREGGPLTICLILHPLRSCERGQRKGIVILSIISNSSVMVDILIFKQVLYEDLFSVGCSL